MEQKEFINRLNNLRSNFMDPSQARAMTKLLNIVSSDIYTESQRFFYEMIQNADDSCSLDNNSVFIDFRDNALIISHNGEQFSEEDIDSITDAGASTKTSKKATTGFKGIGFKSVFMKSKRVSIFSGGFQFRFDKDAVTKDYPWQTIPIWTELNDLPENLRDTVEGLSHPVITIIEMADAHELRNSLNELLGQGQILLFLRRVCKIEIKLNGKIVNTIKKEVGGEQQLSKNVILFFDDVPKSSWLVRTFSDIPVPAELSSSLQHDEKVPEKLRSATHSELTFAAALDGDKIGKLPKEQSLIYTFLPTKVTEFALPYLINGNFLTNAPRESIHQDYPWNNWLFEEIAKLNFVWLSELALSGYKFQVLKLLPKRYGPSSNMLKNSFDSGYNISGSRKFLPANNGDVLSPKEALNDKTTLSEQSFIDKNIILDFLREKNGFVLNVNCYLHPHLEEKSKLSYITVAEFTLDNITDFFASENFVRSHGITENFQLIEFLKDRSDSDHQGILFEDVKKLPFVFDEHGTLRNPKDGVCFPAGDGLQTFDLGDVRVIHVDVFKKIQENQKIYDWLVQLGTETPSETAYINMMILPYLGDEGFVTEENFLKLTGYLVKMYKKGIVTEEMLSRLRTLALKTNGDTTTFIQAQKCYLSQIYRPKVNLESVINLPFVSEDYLQIGYLQPDMQVFFKALSVKDSIEIETITSNCDVSSIADITTSEWVAFTREAGEREATKKGGYCFGLTNLIRGVKLPSFLHHTATDFEYSKMFWKYMLDNSVHARELLTNATFCYGRGNGLNKYSVPVENYFKYFVANNKCIPTSLGTLENSKDVFLSLKEIREIAGEYFPVLEYGDDITTDWHIYFNFKKKLEITDYLSILGKIAAKEGPLLKKDIKNIGRIYNKLAGLLPDLTFEEKTKINDWGKKGYLLSASGTFEPVSELKNISKDGFSHINGLKLFNIPSNCDKDKLDSLITEFGILTIRHFIPQFDGSLTDNDLKNRFEKVLPYLALIAQQRSLEDTDEFDRLFAMLDDLTFNSAEEIYLSFMDGENLVTGPSIKVYRASNCISYKGKWKSERILLELIDELREYLSFSGTNEELRFLLLEPDLAEIKLWLKEKEIDLSNLRATKKFKTKTVSLELDITMQESSKTPDLEIPAVNGTSPTVKPFTAKYKPTNFDYTNIPVHEPPTVSTGGSVENDSQNYMEYYDMSDEEARKGYGKWSEEFVNGYLLKKYPADSIKWMNEHEESYKPYDFELHIDSEIFYIDVKGTPSSTKDLVFLSPPEWRFMIQKGEKYSIYRIYSADTSEPKIKIVSNPAFQIASGALIPYKPSLVI
ncbi:DUF3883 domain-containing protein [Flavobacterium sp. WW92]|uniref:sacsin N-terminal ATP-binding-like domain-containing protein n=1 Tax=unclassified Flavobacterium TaxID=196869 RepID=UPI0022244F84|nr:MULTISPECIES: DUF3883 domain-containing protein [unclassified Flavobacterium]WDO12327.1 DUF3883 domain-containing protein [Flavobacterium sp. WW92]